MSQETFQPSSPEVSVTVVPDSALKADIAATVTEQDLWNELMSNINDFAVAKSIVDFLELASPDLQNQHTALFLRAKVTIKRHQIAYAEAAKAVDNARKSSSPGLLANLDRVLGVIRGADKRITSMLLNPMPLGVVVAVALIACSRWLR